MSSTRPRYRITRAHAIVDTKMPAADGQPLCVCSTRLNALIICNALAAAPADIVLINAVVTALERLTRCKPPLLTKKKVVAKDA